MLSMLKKSFACEEKDPPPQIFRKIKMSKVTFQLLHQILSRSAHNQKSKSYSNFVYNCKEACGQMMPNLVIFFLKNPSKL